MHNLGLEKITPFEESMRKDKGRKKENCKSSGKVTSFCVRRQELGQAANSVYVVIQMPSLLRNKPKEKDIEG